MIRQIAITVLSVVLCLYTLVFVNYQVLQPQSSLALFVMLGLMVCFLTTPAFKFIRRRGFSDSEPVGSADGVRSGGSALLRIDLASRWLLTIATVVCFGHLFVQQEPVFSRFWMYVEAYGDAVPLNGRPGDETLLDYWVGIVGLVLVLEATRRTIGWIVPALAIAFILHAYLAPQLPDWLLPHSGKTPRQIVSATFLQQGVLGPAASVMFRFVFLFVVFGAFLEMSGATQFIINLSERLFGKRAGGPAKVAVLGSGLMGSLSGSAVANAVTTGSFTIPTMKNARFSATAAAGITAAAATGGALVPPVMGAGAYMMLEFVDDITFPDIVLAALIPAFLYYFSLFMIVHFYAKRVSNDGSANGMSKSLGPIHVPIFEGLVFCAALGVLLILLFRGFSPTAAVTGSLILILLLSVLRRKLPLSLSPRILSLLVFFAVVGLHQYSFYLRESTWAQHPYLLPFLAKSWAQADGVLSGRLMFESFLNSSLMGMLGLIFFGIIHPTWRPQILKALQRSSSNGVPLIAASACVGIIIGIVEATSIANDFSSLIKTVVESSLFLALVGIMVGSIILGMGVPSVVCYLLMATLMGALLNELGVAPLAAHLFIFYYGMMSMVTPPVALAAYASASIAEAPIMRTAFASFKFSLVGFTLPFMFIYRPALLLMAPPGESLQWYRVAVAVVASVLGVIALAACVTGYLRRPMSWWLRLGLFASALLLLAPNVGGVTIGILINVAGGVLLAVIALLKSEDRSGASATLEHSHPEA